MVFVKGGLIFGDKFYPFPDLIMLVVNCANGLAITLNWFECTIAGSVDGIMIDGYDTLGIPTFDIANIGWIWFVDNVGGCLIV